MARIGVHIVVVLEVEDGMAERAKDQLGATARDLLDVGSAILAERAGSFGHVVEEDYDIVDQDYADRMEKERRLAYQEKRQYRVGRNAP